MDELLFARAQMGLSLIFHIVFSVLGMALPVLIVGVEWKSLRDPKGPWLALARTWSKAMAVLFVIGAVSGTALSMEFGLLWPTFMRQAGGVIGLPFALEGYAFFVEAIFLGIYIYGWDRLTPRAHWLVGIPIAVSGMMSGAFITIVNAWMNGPVGFDVIAGPNGPIIDQSSANPIGAMLAPMVITQVPHVLLSALVAVGGGVAAVYAWAWLKERTSAYNRAGMLAGTVMFSIAIPLQLVSGHLSTVKIYEEQPAKFAAAEGVLQTGPNQPMHLPFGLEIPGLTSFLINLDTSTVVTGLNDIPSTDLPEKPELVHLAFQLMVGSGLLMMAAAVLFWASVLRRRRAGKRLELPKSRLILWLLVLSGPAGFLAVETGWMVTEYGRQPWVIRGFLTTADAVTKQPGIAATFVAFMSLYAALGAILVWVLLRLRAEHPDTRAGV
ncbi:MAG: cytochrome ubiquinol oxidase subunit I [Candidatus Limnocylindrus sp.]